MSRLRAPCLDNFGKLHVKRLSSPLPVLKRSFSKSPIPQYKWALFPFSLFRDWLITQGEVVFQLWDKGTSFINFEALCYTWCCKGEKGQVTNRIARGWHMAVMCKVNPKTNMLTFITVRSCPVLKIV